MKQDQKDRFGDKLREAERGKEDSFFAAQDRKLLEQARQQRKQLEEAAARQTGDMRCPECGEALRKSQLHGVVVETCRACQGAWLPKHTLDLIAGREDQGWIARWLDYEFPHQP